MRLLPLIPLRLSGESSRVITMLIRDIIFDAAALNSVRDCITLLSWIADHSKRGVKSRAACKFDYFLIILGY